MADRPIALSQFIAERIDAFVGTAQPETAEERRARLERKWLRRRRQREERFGIPSRRAQTAVTLPTGSSPSSAEIAAEVLRRLGPVTRAEFITAGNAEAVTGQDFRWVRAEAERLGVPIAGTGKKRVIDVETFRSALAADAEVLVISGEDTDPVEDLRRKLGFKLRENDRA